MIDVKELEFHFDLWTQPWIGLEKEGGGIERLGIEQTLLRAHEFRGIFELSPLVVVGINRLLTAILQEMFSPETEKELKQCWKLAQAPPDLVLDFHRKYGDRFDLFDREKPFFQSRDVFPTPVKGENIKSIANLLPDIPSGTEHTHYRHGVQAEQIFCPVCVAGGLTALPAFSTSGGSGIKPSINGVPPTYVIPCGKNLLESLLLSLVLPKYQPSAKAVDTDLVWWKREPVIPRSLEVICVGYLHSLTFQPRRVRLYPERAEGSCSRCGEPLRWGVRKMIFDMGESRPKDAPAWFDPFAAYKVPDNKPPIPIRPVAGKATWREYSNLFLKKPQKEAPSKKGKKVENILRPSLLDQIADLREGDTSVLSLRCVGLRTDMKAKVFEWVDSGFEVPGTLLQDEVAAYWIDKAIHYASDCASTIASVFRKAFGGPGKDAARYNQLKNEMMDGYWRQLALPFRKLVTTLSGTTDINDAYSEWVDGVTRLAERSFTEAAVSVGVEGEQLRKRFSGERLCRAYLFSAKKKELNHE
ncbi:MAG TPA: type I-E CRISPR-associated protein Cse1/CasA [Anaerolineaceae bacterium]|nr:type I-E CRISPR-associated protein Cse1/CasA [Anaerolineaceae bacterium]